MRAREYRSPLTLRVVKRWWSHPGGFRPLERSNISPELMAAARALMAVTTLGFVAAPIALLVSVIDDGWSWRLVVAVMSILFTAAWSALWLFGPWPTRRTSALFVTLASLSFAGTTAAVDIPLAGLVGCCAMAVLSGYVGFVHGPKALTAQVGFTIALAAAHTVRLLVTDDVGIGFPLVGFLVVVLLNVANPLFGQVVLTLLSAEAGLSLEDPLTGLLNRRGLAREAERPRRRAEEREDVLVAAMIDLDKFKEINDSLGHDEGDKVIAGTAERLRGACRAEDAVARTGGEEFVVLTNLRREDVGTFGERLRSIIEGGEIPITASVGVAWSRHQVASGSAERRAVVDSLVRRADKAMYQAKHGGGNAVEVLELDGPE